MKVLTSLEIACAVKELQKLVNSRLSRVYQPNNEGLILAFHTTGTGKTLLRIISGKCIYITKTKPEIKEQFNFCRFLRKRIQNSKLESIEQKNFERIIEFCFQTKEEKYFLITELFSKGNIILCKEDYTILSALQVQLWKDRKIKALQKYVYPPIQHYNIFKLNIESFKKAVKESNKENIVKTLATDLGLGGVYAEELCKRSNVDKNKKSLSEEETKKIFEELKNLTKLEIKANITEDDVFPFEMKTKKSTKKIFSTFNEALNSHYTQIIREKTETEQENVYKQKIMGQQKILGRQKEQIKKMRESIEANKQKGNLIYKNYTYIKEVLEVIKKARDKKISWEEIATKLKTKGIETKQKEGKIILELK